MFGHGVQNRVVWKLLLQNPCLNSMFWNVAGADFKQQTDVSDGTSIIKLNSLISFFGLCSDPPDQLFFNLCFLSSLYSHLFTPQTQLYKEDRAQSELTHLISFFFLIFLSSLHAPNPNIQSRSHSPNSPTSITPLTQHHSTSPLTDPT